MLLRTAAGSDRARRLFLAIPSYGNISPLVVHSLLESQIALLDEGYGVEIAILSGKCHVDDARNILVAEFLQSSCDELIFIDADIVFEPHAIRSLVEIDRDVAAIAYPKKDNNPKFAVSVSGDIWSDSDGLIKASSAGTGFMKIRRGLLQRMFDEARKYQTGEHDIDCAEVFRRSINGNGHRVSGDVDFCYRAGGVYVDPEVRLSHTGESVWTGVWGSHLRRNSGLSLLSGIEKIRRGEYSRLDIPTLIDDWGNEGFAAGHELIAACIEVAQDARGPILETGAGLSSLVMAATGAEVHALESEPNWYEVMQREKERLGLYSLHVHYAPLSGLGSGRWYSDTSWPEPDIVVCDGPKRDKGNRYVLLERLNGYVPRYFLLDDIDEVSGPLKVWGAQKGVEFRIMGQLRKFAVGVRI